MSEALDESEDVVGFPREALGQYNEVESDNPFLTCPDGNLHIPKIIDAFLTRYGPTRLPPEWIRSLTTELAESIRCLNLTKPQLLKQIGEIVFAVGLGYRRKTKSNSEDPWEARWPNVEKRFFLRLRQLAFQVISRDLSELKKLKDTVEDQISQAMLISHLCAIDFLEGVCHCGRHNRSCSKDCKERCCRPHSIQDWDAARTTFTDFVDTAIRGTPINISFKRNAFQYSILRVHVQEYFRLEFGKVLFHQCPICHLDYQYDMCSSGHRTGLKTYHYFKESWAYLPDSVAGWYEEKTYWQCQNSECGNLFATDQSTRCPICGSWHKQRPHTCMVFHPIQIESLNYINEDGENGEREDLADDTEDLIEDIENYLDAQRLSRGQKGGISDSPESD